MDHISIFTDGAVEPNPGKGGYGIVMLCRGRRLELSGGFRFTTNNRMELYPVIIALQRLKNPGSSVVVYSDSQYVVGMASKGVYKTQRKQWHSRKRGPTPNVDLWKMLLPLLVKHDVDFEWVRGHNGNAENERCDYLAGEARRVPNLPADLCYENPPKVELPAKSLGMLGI